MASDASSSLRVLVLPWLWIATIEEPTFSEALRHSALGSVPDEQDLEPLDGPVQDQARAHIAQPSGPSRDMTRDCCLIDDLEPSCCIDQVSAHVAATDAVACSSARWVGA